MTAPALLHLTESDPVTKMESARSKTVLCVDDERIGLRVRKSGAHSWMIKYFFGGRVRRMALGPLSALDPGKAFDTAKDLMAQIRVGRDPAAEKAARSAAFSDL